MVSRASPDGWGVPGDWRTYFEHDDAQKLAELVLDLASVTWTLMDRLQVLEWDLERRGLLEKGLVDSYVPTKEEESILTAKRDAFLKQVLQSLTRDRADN